MTTTMFELLHQSTSLAHISACGNRLSGKLEETESSSVYSQSEGYQIKLNFSCEVVLEENLFHDGLISRYDVIFPEIEFNLLLYLRNISDLEEPRYQQLFKSVILRRLNLSEGDEDLFSSEGIRSTLEFMGSALPGQRIFNLEFKLSLVHSHNLVPRTFEEGQLLFEWITESQLQENADAGGPQMVPATEESIRNLKRKRVQDDSEDDDCVICLEELMKGCEVVLMPCAHSFHGDCIEEWLKKSHYCPICRYEIPTE